MKDHRLIPEKYRFLSGSWLKLLAVAAMLVDHTAHCFLQNDPTVLVQVFGRTLTLYQAMRLFGRLAFPLFAFLLVEGFHHTKDRNRYGLRLLLFALVSEIPWNLMRNGTLLYPAKQNVLFTLLLGFAGLCAAEKLERDENRVRNVLLLLGLFALSLGIRSDYGGAGFSFILLLYLTEELPVCRALVGVWLLPGKLTAAPAFVPIAFYNGKRGFIRGRVSGLLFYAVYPLHLLILYRLMRRAGG